MVRLPELAAELTPARADARRCARSPTALRAGDGDGAAAAARPQLERPLRVLGRAA